MKKSEIIFLMKDIILRKKSISEFEKIVYSLSLQEWEEIFWLDDFLDFLSLEYKNLNKETEQIFASKYVWFWEFQKSVLIYFFEKLLQLDENCKIYHTIFFSLYIVPFNDDLRYISENWTEYVFSFDYLAEEIEGYYDWGKYIKIREFIDFMSDKWIIEMFEKILKNLKAWKYDSDIDWDFSLFDLEKYIFETHRINLNDYLNS